MCVCAAVRMVIHHIRIHTCIYTYDMYKFKRIHGETLLKEKSTELVLFTNPSILKFITLSTTLFSSPRLSFVCFFHLRPGNSTHYACYYVCYCRSNLDLFVYVAFVRFLFLSICFSLYLSLTFLPEKFYSNSMHGTAIWDHIYI